MGMTHSEWKFVEPVDDQTMPQVVVRAAAVQLQIEGIARDVAVSARRYQRIVGIVNSVRPSVGRLEVDSTTESFVERGLQSVVGSVPDRFGFDGLVEYGVSGHLG